MKTLLTAAVFALAATVTSAATFSVVTVDETFTPVGDAQIKEVKGFSCQTAFEVIMGQMKVSYPNVTHTYIGREGDIKLWMVMPNDGSYNVLVGCVE